MTATRRLAAIRVADVAGYSRLIEDDEEGTLMLPVSATTPCPDRVGPRLPTSAIARPQCGARGKSRGRQQVGVDIPDAAPEQHLTIDQAEHFLIRGDDRLRQVV